MRITRIAETHNTIVSGDADLTLMKPLLEKYSKKPGSLIPLLQGTQALYGFLPSGAFRAISEATGIAPADIYGVATFYAQFRLSPVGKNIIKVCHGTACHVQNANAITDAIKDHLGVNDGETTADGEFTLESVACLGCCSLAPVMMIGENTYGKLNGKSAVKILREIKKQLRSSQLKAEK
ncbi:MAG: NADH-quinone oxidoreductase subunit NuoE [Bacteroidales bacterium]|jgi:NADH-quinone oxidoreductase subunit E|nr:NADH-quinone oxidoreductase subunit NuoE [Bacteroidales bacterium]MDN5348777.1 NADH-quinone oxidoreductase subunit [Bacteroidales bacterium]